MSYLKFFFLFIIVLVVILGTFFCVFLVNLKKIDFTPKSDKYTIVFEEIQEKLFIETRIWGLAGNHEAILISSTPISSGVQYLKDREYVFLNSELFYKKTGIDTLLLRVYHKVEVPEKMFTKIKIIQKEFESANEINDYMVNYEKYGFFKILRLLLLL